MNRNVKKFIYLLAFLFFGKVVVEINYESLKEVLNINILNLIFVFIFLTLGQLFIGLVWSNFVFENYKIDKKISIEMWTKSIAAKYIPGKIASPILRVENEVFKNIKIELYNHMLIETILLILVNICLGSYVFLNEILDKKEFLILINLSFYILFRLKGIKVKKFNLSYLKNIYYIEFISFLNILGIYFLISSLNFSNQLELTLIYIFVSGITMLIFIVPAGIGIRENFFIEISKVKDFNELLVAPVSILIRVSMIVVDLLFVTFSLTYYRKK